MIRGAKAIILDAEDTMLLLYRSKTHPYVPHTPDLPGGKVEDDETMIEGLLREIKEETGIHLDESLLRLVGDHTKQNYYGNDYHLELYEVRLGMRPNVSLSYEHEMFKWVPQTEARVVGELYSALLQSYQHSRIAEQA